MQAWLQQRCILIFVQYLRPPRTDSFMRFESVPLLYYEWKKILLCSNTPSSYRTYVLFIYADGGKYLSILLWKQMLRLRDRGPFCSCDFLTENWSCDKLSGRIFSEKPPIYIFFSVPSPKQTWFAWLGFSSAFDFFMAFTWILHLWVSFTQLKRKW